MMIHRKTHSHLFSGHGHKLRIHHRLGFLVRRSEYERYLKEAKTAVPYGSQELQEAWAAYNAKYHHTAKSHPALIVAILIAVAILLATIFAKAEPPTPNHFLTVSNSDAFFRAYYPEFYPQIVQPLSPLTMNLGSVGGLGITLGQTTSQSSLPVVIASDQSAVRTTVQPSLNPQPVTIVPNQLSPLPVNNKSPTIVYVLQGNTLVPVVLTEGQSVMARSVPVAIASDQPGQYVDNQATGLVPAGTMMLAWDQVAKTARAITVAAGTDVLAVNVENIIQSLVSQNTNPWLTQDNADVLGGGITPPSQVLMIGGRTSDITPQYSILPLSSGGLTVPVSISQPRSLLQPCNPVRTTNCQHF